MAMLPEVLDAVVGADTHRDTNQGEHAYPSGAMIVTRSLGNHSAGHADALAWMFEHAPGPRTVVSIEGTRSYGARLARAVKAAGIPVIEAEQPSRQAPEARVNPTRSTGTWPCCPHSASARTNCSLHIRTETERPLDHPGFVGGRWFWKGSRAWQRPASIWWR